MRCGDSDYETLFDMIELNERRDVSASSSARICSIGVFDTISDPDIRFDKDGVSNYYHEYRSKVAERVDESPSEDRLIQLAEQIAESGKKGSPDCLIGISGGCRLSLPCRQSC